MTASEIKRCLKWCIHSTPYVKIKRKKYIEMIRSHYDYNKGTPSILCSTCIGGMIYNNLGLKFMTPTINLWCTAEDLSKIAENPQKYFSHDIEFIHNDKDYDYSHPVGRIDDVVIYFTHYKTESEAASKWYERRERFNYDNVYIITDDNGLSAEGRQRLIKSKHKRLIIFSAGENTDENSFVYKCYKNGKLGRYSVRGTGGFAAFEKEFDYAAWLSGKDEIRINGGPV